MHTSGPGEPGHGESNLSKNYTQKPSNHDTSPTRTSYSSSNSRYHFRSAMLYHPIKSLPTNFAAKEKAGIRREERNGMGRDVVSKADDDNNNNDGHMG